MAEHRRGKKNQQQQQIALFYTKTVETGLLLQVG